VSPFLGTDKTPVAQRRHFAASEKTLTTRIVASMTGRLTGKCQLAYY
jgi:hypothetical protein